MNSVLFVRLVGEGVGVKTYGKNQAYHENIIGEFQELVFFVENFTQIIGVADHVRDVVGFILQHFFHSPFVLVEVEIDKRAEKKKVWRFP